MPAKTAKKTAVAKKQATKPENPQAAKKAAKPAKVAAPAALDDLAPNPRNPRKPWNDDAQQAAFRKSLEEFGDLSGVVFNLTTGQLVGGHKRVDEFKRDAASKLSVENRLPKPDKVGTVAYGHVLLSSGVRFAYREVKWAAAKEAAANLAANRWGADWLSEGVADLLSEVREGGFSLELTGFAADEIGSFLGEFDTTGGGLMPNLPNGERAPFQQMTFTLHDSQVEVLKQAIAVVRKKGKAESAVNENGNGNALAELAAFYLSKNPGK